MANDEPVALVTGANKGLGREIARQLAMHGNTVIVGARDPDAGRTTAEGLTAGGANARHVTLDVTDAASVTAAAQWIDDEFGRLDILVNNAGIASTSVPSQTALNELRTTYETNVFGVITVTNAMLPLLRRAPAPRVVNMSSDLGSLARMHEPERPVLLAYNSSKTALNAITVQYAKELQDTPIKVNAVNPGFSATDLTGHQGHRTTEQGAKIAVEFATLPDDGPTAAFYEDEGEIRW